MIVGGLAKRYARALAEVAAEADALESVGAELMSLAKLWQEEPAMAAFFGNPGILHRDKLQVLERLAKRMAFSPLLTRFLGLLLARDRMQALPGMARIYRDLMNKHLGRVQAGVTTAVPLGSDLAERLGRRMAEVLGETVLLEPLVDPAILGGIVVQVDSTVYDGSLRTQLGHLREHLLRE
ncbi:MAG: ATP synthase F1 subunit delta [Candidatus Methylomirabilales bacterium]